MSNTDPTKTPGILNSWLLYIMSLHFYKCINKNKANMTMFHRCGFNFNPLENGICLLYMVFVSGTQLGFRINLQCVHHSLYGTDKNTATQRV